MAQILRHFDIVAIQEVVAKDPAGAQAVARLVDALNRTGYQWDYRISDPTKSPSVYMSARYAFLWKPSRVAIQHRAFLDKERVKNEASKRLAREARGVNLRNSGGRWRACAVG